MTFRIPALLPRSPASTFLYKPSSLSSSCYPPFISSPIHHPLYLLLHVLALAFQSSVLLHSSSSPSTSSSVVYILALTCHFIARASQPGAFIYSLPVNPLPLPTSSLPAIQFHRNRATVLTGCYHCVPYFNERPVHFTTLPFPNFSSCCSCVLTTTFLSTSLWHALHL